MWPSVIPQVPHVVQIGVQHNGVDGVLGEALALFRCFVELVVPREVGPVEIAQVGGHHVVGSAIHVEAGHPFTFFVELFVKSS